MAQTRGKTDDLNKDMIRLMVLNSIRGYNVKFGNEYGKQVLCADGADPWRRTLFPHYKYQRRKGREDSDKNWDNIFQTIADIRNEIADNFPYVVLHKDGIEADDLIAVLTKEHHKDEKILIVSGDKDFIQLQKYKNVIQYSPIQQKFVGEDLDPIKFLHEQVIKGDRSDGIPNILSPDDIFVTGEKQRPINKKRLEEWSNIKDIPLGSETKKYYNRNKKLIDLDLIPGLIYNDIKNMFIKYEVKNRSQLLDYFIKNKLKSLIDKINDF